MTTTLDRIDPAVDRGHCEMKTAASAIPSC